MMRTLLISALCLSLLSAYSPAQSCGTPPPPKSNTIEGIMKECTDLGGSWSGGIRGSCTFPPDWCTKSGASAPSNPVDLIKQLPAPQNMQQASQEMFLGASALWLNSMINSAKQNAARAEQEKAERARQAEEARIMEQQRRQAISQRLSSLLADDGSNASNADLQLVFNDAQLGIKHAANAKSATDQSGGYGIKGLPGVYTGGAAGGQSASGGYGIAGLPGVNLDSSASVDSQLHSGNTGLPGRDVMRNDVFGAQPQGAQNVANPANGAGVQNAANNRGYGIEGLSQPAPATPNGTAQAGADAPASPQNAISNNVANSPAMQQLQGTEASSQAGAHAASAEEAADKASAPFDRGVPANGGSAVKFTPSSSSGSGPGAPVTEPTHSVVPASSASPAAASSMSSNVSVSAPAPRTWSASASNNSASIVEPGEVLREAVAIPGLPPGAHTPSMPKGPTENKGPAAATQAKADEEGGSCEARKIPMNPTQPRVSACGMIEEHRQAFTSVAKAKCEVIVVQNVNDKSSDRLLGGLVPKPMQLKAKTERDGTIAGMVKAPGSDACTKNGWSWCTVVERKGSLVYANPQGVPFTSDYDLMMIARWHGDESPLLSGTPLGSLTMSEATTVLELNLGIQAINSGINDARIKQWEAASNSTTRELSLICPHCDFVTHGPASRAPEQGAKAPQPSLPACAFEPNGNVVIIGSDQELTGYVSSKRQQGFDVPLHTSWTNGIQSSAKTQTH